jgi:uncharacterized protein (TIGR02246 family)
MGKEDFPKDASEIRALLDRYATGWAKSEVPLLKSLWDEKYPDCSYVASEKENILYGIETIHRYYDETLAGFSISTADISNVRIISFRPDLAYAFCDLHITWEWQGKERIDHPRATFVLRKREDDWYVIHYHESIKWEFPE